MALPHSLGAGGFGDQCRLLRPPADSATGVAFVIRLQQAFGGQETTATGERSHNYVISRVLRFYFLKVGLA